MANSSEAFAEQIEAHIPTMVAHVSHLVAWRCAGGRLEHDTEYCVQLEPKGGGKADFLLIVPADVEVLRMTYEQFQATFVQLMFAFSHGTTYAEIKEDVNWLKMYQAKKANVEYVEGVTPRVIPNSTVIPCHECGLVLPIERMTIDHVEPRSGDGDLAVVKVLRMLNIELTREPSTGGKANYLRGGSPAVPTRLATGNPLTHKANVRIKKKPFSAFHASHVEGKYTLSEKGTLFYSVLRGLMNAASNNMQFEKFCLHSFFNLSPLCTTCNPSKGKESYKSQVFSR